MLLHVTVVRRLVYGLTSLTWCLPACCVMGQAPHSWQARLGLVSAASTTPARLTMHSHTTLPLVHKSSTPQSTSFLTLHPLRRGSCHHTASLTPHPLCAPTVPPQVFVLVVSLQLMGLGYLSSVLAREYPVFLREQRAAANVSTTEPYGV